MRGNTGEIQLGSERKLYKYINHAVVTKASSKSILVQVYNIFGLAPLFSSDIYNKWHNMMTRTTGPNCI